MNMAQYTICVVGDKTGKTILIEQFVTGDLRKIPKDNCNLCLNNNIMISI